MALKVGDILAGKYRVERLLGEGGMGAVFVATNTVLQKRVALKVMNERFTAMQAAVERFLREAVAASRVSHPSIVQVFDAGEHDGSPWIAMELLEGESLGERLERGPLSLDEVLRMADGALSALAEVHEEGIIHRDLKPDNIFLARTRGGGFTPKVLDFGVAKDTSDGQLNKLTATGAVVGTAHYLSPEQAKGLADIDARTDVYAMGVVLFESLSGRMPYEAETITQLIAKMFTEHPRKLDEVAPNVPRPIAEVVNACLDLERERRFQTARSLLDALREAAEVVKNGGHATSSVGLAATAYGQPLAMRATALGGGDLRSGPGMPSHPGAYASSPGSHPGMSSPGSHPGMSHPGMSSPGSHPGMSHPGMSSPGSHPGMSSPGAYASSPGAYASSPGSQPGPYGSSPSHPGAFVSSPGSHPGTYSSPGSLPGGSFSGVVIQSDPAYSSPAGMIPHTPLGTPMPASHAGFGPQSIPAKEEKRSRGGLYALVFLLFLLGAGGTGVGVWAFLGKGETPRTPPVASVEPANATNTTTQLPPTEQEAPTPTEERPTPAEEHANELTANDTAEQTEERDDEGSSRRRRRDRERGRGEQQEEQAPQQAAAPPTPPPAQPPPTAPQVPPPVFRPPPPVFRPPPPPPQAARMGISQGQVTGTVRARVPRLQSRCYQRAAAQMPGLRGVISVSFVVQSDGRSESVAILQNTTGSEWLGRCTIAFVRETRFPASANGLPTPVRYPFQFP